MTFDLRAQLSLSDNFTRPMRRVTEQMKIATKASRIMSAKYAELTSSAGDYGGKTDEFIGKIADLGKQEKKLVDEMVAGNDRMRSSFYKSIGSILARSTQSEKVAQNFERMGNPIYKLNAPLLKVSQGLEEIAKKGKPAHLALKMLGPTANMKQLNDMTRMINAGLMRFTAVSLVAGIAAVAFYGILHKTAMKANEEYKKAFEGMQASMSKAFDPLVEVFAKVMTPVFKFIGAVADMISKFNEAHPVLAKIIAGFVLLLPAITLLLAPLAIGIGYFGGLSAAMAGMWPLIGPIVTGFATMMGTVLGVTGVITGLSAAVVYIKNNFSAFKEVLIEHQTAIKAVAIALGLFLGPALIRTAAQAAMTGAVMLGSFVASLARTAVQATITAATMTGQLIVSIVNYALAGWKAVASITAQTVAWIASRAVMVASAVTTGVMTAAQWALNAAMTANPIGLVIAAIAALTAAGIYLYRNWDVVKAKTIELWNKLGFLKGAVLALLGPFGSIVSAGVAIWRNFDTIKSKAGEMVNSVISGVNKMVGVLNKIPGVNIPIVPKVSWGNVTSAPQYSAVRGQGRQTSHAGGLSRVPYDGYSASLHRGERVLTKRENKAYSSGAGVGVTIAKLADQIIIREDADIDRITDGIVRKIIAAGGAGA